MGGALSLFPFAPPAFPFSLKTHPFSLETPPIPQSSYPTLVGFIGMNIGGWGETGKLFRVVPCVRTCVRAVLGLVRFQPNRAACPFPFPFLPAGFSLFPCDQDFLMISRILVISLISMIPMSPSESK